LFQTLQLKSICDELKITEPRVISSLVRMMQDEFTYNSIEQKYLACTLLTCHYILSVNRTLLLQGT